MARFDTIPSGIPEGTVVPEEDKGIQWHFECPGCGLYHGVRVRPYKGELDFLNDARRKAGLSQIASIPCWTWNGNNDKPTFTPSLLCRVEYTDGKPTMVCHSYITDGMIQFLSDCTHSKAGQTLPLPKE